MIRSFIFMALLICPHVCLSQVGVDLDTARIVKPQHAEVIGGAVGSRDAWAISAKGRLGFTEALDGHLALSGVYVEDDVGFEFEMGGRYAVLGNKKIQSPMGVSPEISPSPTPAR